MPVPKFPGHLPIRAQRIDDARTLRSHAQDDEAVTKGLDPAVSFQLGKLLGSGTFGKVYEGMNTLTGEMVAIKSIDLSSASARRSQLVRLADKEIEVMRTLRHPNIVAIKGSIPAPDTYNIIMELVPGRSIADLLLAFGPFHEQKGKNILLTTTGSVRLCDFGSAKFREVELDAEGGGSGMQAASAGYSYTPLWVAPETITTHQYNEKVDIWALGCVMIEMASGKDPWSEKGFKHAQQAIFFIGSSGEIPRIPASLSAAGAEFCRLCFTRNPEHRPSAHELLQHRWIVGEAAAAAAAGLASPSASGAGSMTSSAASATEQLDRLKSMVDSQVGTMAASLAPSAAAPMLKLPTVSSSGASASAAASSSALSDTMDSEPPPPPPPADALGGPAHRGGGLMLSSGSLGSVLAHPAPMVGSILAHASSSQQRSSIGLNAAPGSGIPRLSDSSSSMLDSQRNSSRIFHYHPSGARDADDSLGASSSDFGSAGGAGGDVSGAGSLTSSVVSYVEGTGKLHLQAIAPASR